MSEIVLDIVTLILDNDHDTLEFVGKKLVTQPQLSYKLFHDENDFLEILSDNNIHVVVIDHFLNLGGARTGLDVVKIVKGRNRENYVIGYTGMKQPKILIEYINSEIDSFVDKDEPDHLDILVRYIQRGLQIAERRAEFLNYFESKQVR